MNDHKIEYNEVKAYFDKNIVIPKFLQQNALIGPKAAGKSTLLYAAGIRPKPEFAIGDGTKQFTRYGSHIDCIGVDFDGNKIRRLVAYFVSEGIPKNITVIVSANQALIAMLALRLNGIGDVNMACLVPQNMYGRGLGRGSIYHEESYNQMPKQFSNVIMVRAEDITKFNLKMDSVFYLRLLFPENERILLPEYSKIVADQNPSNLQKYLICREIKKFRTIYKGKHEGEMNYINE